MSQLETQIRDASVSPLKIQDDKYFYYYTIATAGEDLNQYDIIAALSWDGTNDRLEVYKARNIYVVGEPRGVAMATVSAGSPVECRSRTFIPGLNTAAYSVGTGLYLGNDGDFTYVQPESPSAFIYLLGFVAESHATDGVVVIDPSYGNMVTPNAYRYSNEATANTAIGIGALGNWVSSTYSTGLGSSTGNTEETGEFNTYVGASADTDAKASSYRTVVGAQAEGNEDNSVTLGRGALDHVFISTPPGAGKSMTYPKAVNMMKFECTGTEVHMIWKDALFTDHIAKSSIYNAFTNVDNNWSASQTVTGKVNVTSAYDLNGTSINTTGTLSNVAYKDQDNEFLRGQTITGTAKATTVNATSAIQLNGVSINTGGTLSNVAYLDTANTFTHASGITTTAGIYAMTAYYASADNGGPSFMGYKSRGTYASPTATLLDDPLLNVIGRGHTGSGWLNSAKAYITMRAAENWSTTTTGTYMRFYVTPIGSTSAASHFEIRSTGLTSASTYVDPPSNHKFGSYTWASTATAADVTGPVTGFAPVLYINGVNNHTSTISGANSVVYNSGSGTATTVYAHQYVAGCTSSGGITNLNLLYIATYSPGGAGTIGTLVGLNIADLNLYNTPTTVYGIKLAASTGSGSIAKYGMYMGSISGSMDSNDFAIYTNDGIISLGGAVYLRGLGTLTGKADVQYDTSTKQLGYVTSSLRYKTNLMFNPDTSWVYELIPVRFDRIDNTAIGEIGLIAEHVEQVRGSICCYDQKHNLVSYSKSELIIPLLNELILLEQRVSQLEDPHGIKDKLSSLKERIQGSNKPVLEELPIVVKEWKPHDPEPERHTDVQFVPPIPGPSDPVTEGDSGIC